LGVLSVSVEVSVQICLEKRYRAREDISIRWILKDLINRWSQPLAAVMARFDFMKQFSMLQKLAAASGGSAPSR
jgi:hypothetical protein